MGAGEHYVDSGYALAELVVGAREAYALTFVTPVLVDQSPQARARSGYDRSALTVDWDNQQVTCPQGRRSTSWSPCVQRGTDAMWSPFPPRHAVRARSARSARPPPENVVSSPFTAAVPTGLEAARAEQASRQRQDQYKICAGVEGTIRSAIGLRRAHSREIKKVHLEHVFSAVTLNLIRLDAWWNGTSSIEAEPTISPALNWQRKHKQSEGELASKVSPVIKNIGNL
ncbi:transposase [Nonomuraea sp. B19D2]|uniref:transposase n=1 Tax=Nonomuraea sp. B19D2 TaxID=3159561 RepID=UPI0032DB82E2